MATPLPSIHQSNTAPPAGVIIGLSAQGKLSLDEICVSKIVLDRQAQHLVQQRATKEEISLADAFEKTLLEALREHMDKHEPNNWWV